MTKMKKMKEIKYWLSMYQFNKIKGFPCIIFNI